MDRKQLVQKWQEFMEEYDYESKAIAVADCFPDKRSLWVEYEEIDAWDTGFLDHIFEYPDCSFEAAESAIQDTLPADLRERVEKHTPSIHLRIQGIPTDRVVKLSDVKWMHNDKLVGVVGIVRKVGPKSVIDRESAWYKIMVSEKTSDLVGMSAVSWRVSCPPRVTA